MTTAAAYMRAAFADWQYALRHFTKRESRAAYMQYVQARHDAWGPPRRVRPKPKGARSRTVGAARTRRYRRHLARAAGYHTQGQWLARVEFYGWKCAYCGRELTGATLVKEHAIPLSRGGANWPANLMPACKPCNSRKRDKTPIEDGWRF